MPTDNGWSNQKKLGTAQFETVHHMGSSSYAKFTGTRSLFEKDAAQAVVSITDILGANGLVQYWDIECTATTAEAGDVIRFISTSPLPNFEFEIISVSGGDTIRVLPISTTKPAIADQFKTFGWVTKVASSDGSEIVTIDPAGLATEAKQDDQITWLNAIDDNITDSNSILTAINGKTATLVSGRVPVDGSGVTQPVSVASLPLPTGAATEAKQDTGNSSLSSIDSKFTTLNAKDFATSAKQDTGNTSLSSIDGKLTTLNAKDFATETTLAAMSAKLPASLGQKASSASLAAVLSTEQEALIGALTETAPASDTASSGLNGRLQRIAQRLTSLIALIPASLGQKSMANSFAVVIASDQSALSVTQAALAVTFQEDTTVTTAAETFTAPAGAKSVVIQAPSSNTVNLRVRLSGTATTSSGYVFEPGRSEVFPFAADVSYIAESGSNQTINAHFGA